MLIDQTIGAHHSQFGLGWDAAWTWVSGEASSPITLPDPYRHRSFATSDDRMRAPTPATDDRLRTTLGSDDRLRESSRAVV